jgi:hypothetical protein
MDRPRATAPPHLVIDDVIPGIARVALREFGGGYLSPALADIRVRGRTVVQVVAPESAASDEADTQRFRDAVRRFAQTTALLHGRSGMTISYAFDPAGAVPESVSRR